MNNCSSTPLLNPKALPPFASLRAFEAVGRLGGIRKAASSLSLDHAVVSRHIRALETWLGIALFHREAGGLSLTEAGILYHKSVSAALVELASATANIVQHPDLRSLRLWCVPGFAAKWLAAQLADFEIAYPDYQIELRPTDVPANLIMHEADVDIRFYGDNWLPRPGGRGLKHVELARPDVVAIANPVLAAKLGDLNDPAELLDAPLLHEEHDEQWRSWFRLNNVVIGQKPISGVLLWHAHLAIAAARGGRGVALANRYLIGRDVENGSLVELGKPIAWRAVTGGYVFVTREDRWRYPIVTRLRQFLQARLQKGMLP